VGSIPSAVPRLMSTWSAKSKLIPVATSMPNTSGARSAARAQLWAERRAAVTRAGAQARAAATSFVREMQFRVGRPSQA